MTRLAEGIWLYPYRLTALGVNIGRNVTVIRLESGRLVIHSTAPFTEADIGEIRKLGEPGWLVEGMVDHDTFSGAGRKAFPEIPFLAPAGFQTRVDFPVGSLDAPPMEWLPELEVIRIDGAPMMVENLLFLHRGHWWCATCCSISPSCHRCGRRSCSRWRWAGRRRRVFPSG